MSYDIITMHHNMIFDEHRNALYGDAIRKIVNSKCIVLDLGTGLGIHGFIAAKAGARKVYMVDPAKVLTLAEMVGQSNDFQDIIQYENKKIEEIQIPDTVDIIISVFTGNFLLTEDLLPSLIYARNAFLAPDGKMIPDLTCMEVVPVTAADYYDKYISRCSSPTQGIDYSLLRKFASNEIYYCDTDKFKFDSLADPAELMKLDLMTAEKAECDSKIAVTMTKDGICHGWLGWFKARLGDTWLSTSPEEKPTHWNQAFLPLDPPVTVKAGQILHFELKRLEYGEWTWTVSSDDFKQKHSTFLSRPLSQTELVKKSASHKAKLSRSGKIALEVLQKISGKMSTEEIAIELYELHPDVYSRKSDAMRFVIALIGRYT